MNGNYYFNFSFTSAIPAYQIAPYIRIYGNANPDGVLDGDRGSGAQFVPFTNTEKIFLSGLTTTIYSQVNPSVIHIREEQHGIYIGVDYFVQTIWVLIPTLSDITLDKVQAILSFVRIQMVMLVVYRLYRLHYLLYYLIVFLNPI